MVKMRIVLVVISTVLALNVKVREWVTAIVMVVLIMLIQFWKKSEESVLIS